MHTTISVKTCSPIRPHINMRKITRCLPRNNADEQETASQILALNAEATVDVV